VNPPGTKKGILGAKGKGTVCIYKREKRSSQNETTERGKQ
jgi:hypothetical protein